LACEKYFITCANYEVILLGNREYRIEDRRPNSPDGMDLAEVELLEFNGTEIAAANVDDRGMELLHAGALVLGQPELVPQFEDMNRAGVSVEFGWQRETHAASGTEIGDLLVGQHSHGPVFPACIG
jgi:hypothetical protein